MVVKVIRLAAVVATAVVVIGFALFAVDQAGESSQKQVERLENADRADPSPGGERQRQRRNGPVREAIDDANDVLLKPFAGFVESRNAWAERGVPALLGLLVYGLGLGMLANSVPNWARR